MNKVVIRTWTSGQIVQLVSDCFADSGHATIYGDPRGRTSTEIHDTPRLVIGTTVVVACLKFVAAIEKELPFIEVKLIKLPRLVR